MNWISSFLKNTPLQVNNEEPAVTCANVVLGVMLGPPMKWRQNRNTASIALSTAAGTDYGAYLPLFSFLDTQWLVDAQGANHELNGALSLPKVGLKGQPTLIAPQYDDNAGNITFRVKPLPNGNYTAYLDYQMKMQLMTSAGSTWGTVDDTFLYVFNEGFLALMMLLVNDARFPIFEGYFIAHLLGAQDGLTEQERDIFLGTWMGKVGTIARSQGMVNQGLAGRGK
jgi:hypothetical protein